MPDPGSKPPPLPVISIDGQADLPLAVERAIGQLEARVNARLSVFHEELAVALARLSDPALNDTLPPPATAVQKLRRATGTAAKVLSAAVLGLTAAAEIVAAFRPDLEGPIQVVIKALSGLM